MDMNLARRLDDNSSPSTVEKNFKKLKSPSQHIPRSNGSNSSETDSGNNLVYSMSTKSPRSKNSSQPSSIDPTAITPRFTREKEGPGLTQSTRTSPSHLSSTPSSKELFRKQDCFRNLLHGVLTKAVASALKSTTSSSPCNEELHEKVQQSLSGVGREGESTSTKSSLSSDKGGLLQKLVQEKQTDCLILQQKMDSKNSEIAQLQSVIETLRQTKKQQATKIERLRIALRRASQNVTSARTEANRAEANSADLMMRVQSFEIIVQETKRASTLLSQEQEVMRAGVEGMENERMQLHAAITSHSTIQQNMQQENRRLSQQLRSSKNCLDEVQDKLEGEQSGNHFLKRKYEELKGTVENQDNQCKRLHEDLDSTQALLIDSTSAASESNLALKGCKQALDRMNEANQHLHQQLQKNQASSQKQEVSLEEALNRAKKEHQETKLQLRNQREEFRTLKLQKLAADKRQESQAAKIFALERRLKEATNLITTAVSVPSTSQHPNGKNSGNDSITKGGGTQDFDNTSRKHTSKAIDGFAIPHLGEDNSRTTYKAKHCSICLKQTSGLMKKCECGRKGCKFRAHATCVQHNFVGVSKADLDSNGQEQLSRAAAILCRSPTTSHHKKKSS